MSKVKRHGPAWEVEYYVDGKYFKRSFRSLEFAQAFSDKPDHEKNDGIPKDRETSYDSRLSFQECQLIEKLNNEGYTHTSIAKILKRTQSGVSREILFHGGCDYKAKREIRKYKQETTQKRIEELESKLFVLEIICERLDKVEADFKKL
jgi:predicted transcriptional regulator